MKLRSSGPSFWGAGRCPLQLPGDCKPSRPHLGEKVGFCRGSRLVLCKPLFLFRSVTHTLCFLSTWFPFILVIRMRLDTHSGTFVRAWRGLAALTASLADPLKVTGKDVRWHSLKSQRTYGLISIRVHRSCLRELVIGPFASHAIPEHITMGKGWSSVIGQFGSCAHLLGTTWHRGSSEDCQGLVPARQGAAAGQAKPAGAVSTCCHQSFSPHLYWTEDKWR